MIFISTNVFFFNWQLEKCLVVHRARTIFSLSLTAIMKRLMLQTCNNYITLGRKGRMLDLLDEKHNKL